MRRAGVALLAAIALATPGRAQAIPEPQVPVAVRQSLLARFPRIQTAAWSVTADRSYVAEFQRGAAGMKVTFQPSGEWVESATEIGAITLPQPVQSAVLTSYRGYRFVDVARVDRAGFPTQLFEVHLDKAGETVIVRYQPDGAVQSAKTVMPPPRPVLSPVGTWRGESVCLPAALPGCHDETVVYHVTALSTDATGFDIQVNRIVNGHEEDMAKLACTLDRRVDALYCVMSQGKWTFQLRADSLLGQFALEDGRLGRRVAVRRQP